MVIVNISLGREDAGFLEDHYQAVWQALVQAVNEEMQGSASGTLPEIMRKVLQIWLLFCVELGVHKTHPRGPGFRVRAPSAS